MEHTDSQNVLGRKNAFQECKFSWPEETPFRGLSDIRNLSAAGFTLGCTYNCGYCWSAANYFRYNAKKLDPVSPKGRLWRNPTFMPVIVEDFFRNVGKYSGKLVLLCNTSDPFGSPKARAIFPDALVCLLEAGAYPVILSKGIIKHGAKEYFRHHYRLAEALKNGNPTWWGTSLTTMRDTVAEKIEPGAPAPISRLNRLNEIVDWGKENADGNIRPFISSSWHNESHPGEILSTLAITKRPMMVILELLHRKPTLKFDWKRYIVQPWDWEDRIGELLQLARENSIQLVLKDELRDYTFRVPKLKEIYQEMWRPLEPWKEKAKDLQNVNYQATLTL